MILPSKPLAALVVSIFLGGIIVSSMMGWWQTESNKTAAAFTSGEFAGQANPADIRGSYTFGDVEKNFGITSDILAEAFDVQTGDPSAFQVKSLEAIYAESIEEIGTSSVRLFVAFYLGLPFDLSTDIYLPESAAALLQGRDLTAERSSYVSSHTVQTPGIDAGLPVDEQTPQDTQPVSSQLTPEGFADDSSETIVKGKTTFAELLEWGVSQEAIEAVLGMPMPASPGIKVKDFCSDNDLSFETIKLALQAEVDQVK